MFERLDDPTPPTFGTSHRGGVRARVRARHRRRLAVGGAAGAVVLGVTGVTARAAYRVDDVRRIDVAGTEQSAADGAPVTVLLVGTDGAPALGEDVDRPAMTDTLLLARIDPAAGSIRLLSLPRDLDVSDGAAPVRRLNSVHAEQGIDGLVAEVDRLGFPVDHVAIVDLAGFRDLVDEVGGVEVAVASPLRDRSSGLVIDAAGCRRLDGAQALALARARHLERLVDGTWLLDGTGDIGRMERQRAFLTAAFASLGDQVPTPFTADRLAGWAQEHLTVDAGLGTAELVGLIRSSAQIGPDRVESIGLPVVAATRDGVAALRAVDPAATAEWFERGAPLTEGGTTADLPAAGDPAAPEVSSADLIEQC